MSITFILSKNCASLPHKFTRPCPVLSSFVKVGNRRSVNHTLFQFLAAVLQCGNIIPAVHPLSNIIAPAPPWLILSFLAIQLVVFPINVVLLTSVPRHFHVISSASLTAYDLLPAVQKDTYILDDLT